MIESVRNPPGWKEKRKTKTQVNELIIEIRITIITKTRLMIATLLLPSMPTFDVWFRIFGI